MSKLPARSAVAVGIVAVAMLWTFPWQPEINNPNENVRVYMTAAIVEEGTYAIDGMRARWGWVNDAAVFEGKAYSVKAPGTSLLGIPAYAVYHWIAGEDHDRGVALWWLRFTASILPTLVFLFFMHRWLSRETPHAVLRDATFLSIALGSLLYGYALLYVSHTLSAVAAFGAFMLLRDARMAKAITPVRAGLAGLLTAGVTFFEYPGLVASVVLAVYALVALRPWKRFPFFVLGGLIPTLLVMHFQWKAFGSPFTPGHLYVETAALRDAHHEGIYGATGFHADAAFELLLAPGMGLFPLTPLLIFAVVGFVVLIRDRTRRPDAIAALALTVLTYLVICTMNNWRGGWTIGPRYLAVVVPFVGWAALHGLSWIANRRPRVAAALALGTTLAAMIASGIPGAYYPHLPPEFTHPIPQLFAVLIADDYAPYAAPNLVGIYGTASMIPLALLALGSMIWCVTPALLPRDRAIALLGALGIAVVALLPAWIEPEPEPPVERAVAFVKRTWRPVPEAQ
jgi:hypothetical protein